MFAQRGFLSSRWGTFLTDLTRDETSLWASIDHSGRKCVKKARTMGATVVRMNSFEDYVTRFYGPYCAVEIAAGRSPNPVSVSEAMWREDTERYYRYYIVASAEGETLATLGMYLFNSVATETASALTPLAYSQKIPAQDLLHWELMLEAKRSGCHTFDLAGVSPDPTDAKSEGIRRFKQKWGGVYSEYSRFELTRAGALASLRGVLRQELNRFRGWRKKSRVADKTSNPQK
jgi:lipid II:glycine glycyltransferase (peptidoglycan interpeptide bridge formation enzyme)